MSDGFASGTIEDKPVTVYDGTGVAPPMGFVRGTRHRAAFLPLDPRPSPAELRQSARLAPKHPSHRVDLTFLRDHVVVELPWLGVVPGSTPTSKFCRLLTGSTGPIIVPDLQVNGLGVVVDISVWAVPGNLPAGRPLPAGHVALRRVREGKHRLQVRIARTGLGPYYAEAFGRLLGIGHRGDPLEIYAEVRAVGAPLPSSGTPLGEPAGFGGPASAYSEDEWKWGAATELTGVGFDSGL